MKQWTKVLVHQYYLSWKEGIESELRPREDNMVDLQSILANHNSRFKSLNREEKKSDHKKNLPTTSEIPDLFFDTVLVQHKLKRVEILILMFLYRSVWCRPNLYKEYGIGPVLSHSEMAKGLDLSIDEIHHAIRKLESLKFIETIRSGQYFVRKYFTEDNDKFYGQGYDNF